VYRMLRGSSFTRFKNLNTVKLIRRGRLKQFRRQHLDKFMLFRGKLLKFLRVTRVITDLKKVKKNIRSHIYQPLVKRIVDCCYRVIESVLKEKINDEFLEGKKMS